MKHPLLRIIIRHWPFILVAFFALLFFFHASSFNYLSQDDNFVKWLSPDETANYTVAKFYAETGDLRIFEKYNLIAKDIIHPRSFRSDYGLIKPVSFLGLPLIYGTLATWFGTALLPYLTPLIGALGLLFFYLLVREVFGKQNALLSSLLASVFPVYLYFSARSMFHNVLFTVCLIIGLYFLVMMAKNFGQGKSFLKKYWRNWLFALLGGLFIGGAIISRASELLWLAPLLLGLWFFNFKRLPLLTLIFFGYGLFFGLWPAMHWNEILYGSWRSMGYPELNQSLYDLQTGGGELAGTSLRGAWQESKESLDRIGKTIFHFGFHPDYSLSMFKAYIKDMFPWLFWGSLAGLVLFIALFKQYTYKKWQWLIFWLGLSTVLVLYYGSWEFYDNPDKNSFTIGNSYTRYWLPVYLGALPFLSLAILWLTSWLKFSPIVIVTRTLIISVLAFVSLQFVWLEPSEGLAVSIEKQKASRLEYNKLLEITEANSIIITKYHDKLLFPERKIIMGAFDDKNMLAEYRRLAERLPVYYYNFTFPEKDIIYLNSRPLKETSLIIVERQKVTDDFTLYSILPIYEEDEDEDEDEELKEDEEDLNEEEEQN